MPNPEKKSPEQELLDELELPTRLEEYLDRLGLVTFEIGKQGPQAVDGMMKIYEYMLRHRAEFQSLFSDEVDSIDSETAEVAAEHLRSMLKTLNIEELGKMIEGKVDVEFEELFNQMGLSQYLEEDEVLEELYFQLALLSMVDGNVDFPKERDAVIMIVRDILDQIKLGNGKSALENLLDTPKDNDAKYVFTLNEIRSSSIWQNNTRYEADFVKWLLKGVPEKFIDTLYYYGYLDDDGKLLKDELLKTLISDVAADFKQSSRLISEEQKLAKSLEKLTQFHFGALTSIARRFRGSYDETGEATTINEAENEQLIKYDVAVVLYDTVFDIIKRKFDDGVDIETHPYEYLSNELKDSESYAEIMRAVTAYLMTVSSRYKDFSLSGNDVIDTLLTLAEGKEVKNKAKGNPAKVPSEVAPERIREQEQAKIDSLYVFLEKILKSDVARARNSGQNLDGSGIMKLYGNSVQDVLIKNIGEAYTTLSEDSKRKAEDRVESLINELGSSSIAA